MTYEAHPIAEAFPLMEGEAFDELVKSVSEHGLQNEIILFEGKILDGRNRYAACVKAGIEPDFVQFEGTLEDAVAHVRINNLHRRNLTTSQRAIAAVRLLELEGKPVDGDVRQAVAEQFNVSRRTVVDAATVLKKGAPELVEQVERGAVSVSRAAQVVRGQRSAEVIDIDKRKEGRGRPKGGWHARSIVKACEMILAVDMTKVVAQWSGDPAHNKALQSAIDRLALMRPQLLEVDRAAVGA